MTERTGSADDTARRFDVELFLVHPTSRPADISTALGMEAHLAHRVGDRRKTPTRAERDEISSEASPQTLEWAEVRLQRAMIDLPERRTKNKKRHLVPLSEPALALLGRVASGSAQACLRPLRAMGPGQAMLDKRILHRRGRALPHWTLHDIRRTFVTNMNELGFAEPHVVEAIVNKASTITPSICSSVSRPSGSGGAI